MELRDTRIEIVTTAEEAALIRSAAQARGLRPATFIRMAALEVSAKSAREDAK